MAEQLPILDYSTPRRPAQERVPISRAAIASLVCGIACLALTVPIWLLSPSIWRIPFLVVILVPAIIAGALSAVSGAASGIVAIWRIARSGGELRGFWLAFGGLVAAVLEAVVLDAFRATMGAAEFC